MNCRRLFLVIGFIVLLALDNSHGQDEEDLDNSVNNNPDDEENSDETIGKLLFDTRRLILFWVVFIFITEITETRASEIIFDPVLESTTVDKNVTTPNVSDPTIPTLSEGLLLEIHRGSKNGKNLIIQVLKFSWMPLRKRYKVEISDGKFWHTSQLSV